MDAWADIGGLVGGGSVLAILAYWGLRVMSQASGDRRDASELLKAEREKHAAEVAGLKAAYAELEKRYEAERQARWAAEDAAAKYRRQVGEQE